MYTLPKNRGACVDTQKSIGIQIAIAGRSGVEWKGAPEHLDLASVENSKVLRNLTERRMVRRVMNSSAG